MRLVIPCHPNGSREFELPPGATKIGRGEDNDVVIADPSISRNHCEIHVASGAAVLRDLDSANGTYINGEPILEIRLQSGMKIRIGTVECAIGGPEAFPAGGLAPGGSIAHTAPPVPGIRVGGLQCVNHPGVAAELRCGRCALHFCQACVKRRRAGMKEFPVCPQCGSVCAPPAGAAARAAGPRTFYQMLPGAFGYPLRQSGLLMLIVGAIFFSLLKFGMQVAAYAFIFGLAGILMLVAVTFGFLFAFMRDIIVSSAQGNDVLPGFPDVTEFHQDILVPFYQFLVIWIACLGPGMYVSFNYTPALGIGMMVAGVFCLPMILLTVSMLDSLEGLNPLLVFASISKAPGAYVTACLLFLVVLAGRAACESLLKLLPFYFFPSLILNFVGLYGLTVEMRIMGLFYRCYHERLGWFR